MHWYQKTRRMSDTRNTPTVPMPSPPQSNIGVLSLRLYHFQPRSSAQSQTRASTRGSIRGRLRSTRRRLRSAFATCPVTAILRFFVDLAPLPVPPVSGAEEERRWEELAAAAARSSLRISCRSAGSWGVPWRSVRAPMTNASASRIEPEHIHVSRPHTFSPAFSMTTATSCLDLPFDNASLPANIAAWFSSWEVAAVAAKSRGCICCKLRGAAIASGPRDHCSIDLSA